MIKYKAMFGEIKAYEIASETAKTVTIADTKEWTGRRENKVTDYYSWHDTWEAAHAHLIAEAQRKVDSLRVQLGSAQGKLGQIKGMKPPKE